MKMFASSREDRGDPNKVEVVEVETEEDERELPPSPVRNEFVLPRKTPHNAGRR